MRHSSQYFIIFMFLWLGALTACFAETPAQYDTALAGVQAMLLRQSALLQHRPANARDLMPVVAQAQGMLNSIQAVQMPGQAMQPVNNTSLLLSLQQASGESNSQARAAAYRSAAGQIATLRADLTASFKTAPASDPHSPATTLRQVLARAEFASDPLPPPSALDRLLAWIERHLPRRHKAGPPPHISILFIKIVTGLLAAGALALLVPGLVRYLRQQSRDAKPVVQNDEEAQLLDARDADSLRALAERQAALREWRSAFRLMYLASLAMLDREASIPYDRSKTNWEYLRALRSTGHADLYVSMLPFTQEFDRVWYGVAPASRQDYEFAVAQFEALRPAAPVSAASAG